MTCRFFLLFPFALHSFRSMYSFCFACAGRIVYICYSNHFIFLYRCYAFAKFFVHLYFHGNLHHDIVNTCIITYFIQPFVVWLNTHLILYTHHVLLVWMSICLIHVFFFSFYAGALIDTQHFVHLFMLCIKTNLHVKKHDISIELDWTKFLIYFY